MHTCEVKSLVLYVPIRTREDFLNRAGFGDGREFLLVKPDGRYERAVISSDSEFYFVTEGDQTWSIGDEDNITDDCSIGQAIKEGRLFYVPRIGSDCNRLSAGGDNPWGTYFRL